MIASGRGHAIAFQVALGQAHDLPRAVPLLDRLPGVPKWVVGDRGYTGHHFREHIWSMGARPARSPRRREAPMACPDWIYNNRNVAEQLRARLKEWRAIATRYEKKAASLSSILCFAATLDYLKQYQNTKRLISLSKVFFDKHLFPRAREFTESIAEVLIETRWPLARSDSQVRCFDP